MNHCIYCGYLIPEGEMCGHHTVSYGEGWAKSNRIQCDFFHRGIIRKNMILVNRDRWGYEEEWIENDPR